MMTCVHLAALERELDAQGIPLGDGGESPYGPDWGTWFEVSSTFDAGSLRARLKIPETVTYVEYDGRVAGTDATWYCPDCKRAIMGLHPRYAPSGMKRAV
jgi:hypothetical protein